MMPSLTNNRWLLLSFVFVGLIGTYRILGPLICAGLITIIYISGSTWYFARVCPRYPSLAFGMMSCFALGSTGLISMHFVHEGGTILIFLLSVFTACALFASGSDWCETRTPTRWCPNYLAVFCVVVFMFLPFSTLFSWPLRVAFFLSQPSMDRLADRIEHGSKMTPPEWTGLFLIWNSEISEHTGDTLLITGSDRSDAMGFLRVAEGTMPDDPNSWPHDLRLSDRWMYQGDPKD
jgi:hypothetical protein